MKRSFVKTASSLTTITLVGCTLIAPSGLSSKVETPTQNATPAPSTVPGAQGSSITTPVPESSAFADTTAQQTPLPTSSASTSTDTATSSPTPSASTDGTAPIPSPTPTVTPTPSPTPSPTPTPPATGSFTLSLSTDMPKSIKINTRASIIGIDIAVAPEEDIDVSLKRFDVYKFLSVKDWYDYVINDSNEVRLRPCPNSPGCTYYFNENRFDRVKVRLGRGTMSKLRINATPFAYSKKDYERIYYDGIYQSPFTFMREIDSSLILNSLTVEGVGATTGATMSITLNASMSSPIITPDLDLKNSTLLPIPTTVNARTKVLVASFDIAGLSSYNISGLIFGIQSSIPLGFSSYNYYLASVGGNWEKRINGYTDDVLGHLLWDNSMQSNVLAVASGSSDTILINNYFASSVTGLPYTVQYSLLGYMLNAGSGYEDRNHLWYYTSPVITLPEPIVFPTITVQSN